MRLAWPSARSCPAAAQAALPTRTRRQGRSIPVSAPWAIRASTGVMSVSPEPDGDMLEPGDHRTGQEDSGSEHEAKMHEHRDIRGLGGRYRAARLAKGDAVQPQEQRAQRDEKSGDQRN